MEGDFDVSGFKKLDDLAIFNVSGDFTIKLRSGFKYNSVRIEYSDCNLDISGIVIEELVIRKVPFHKIMVNEQTEIDTELSVIKGVGNLSMMQNQVFF